MCRRHPLRLCVLIAALLVASCSTRVAPMTESGHDYAAQEDEAWLIAQANLAAAEVDENGYELRDASLTGYVTQIGDRLAPPNLPPDFRFRYHVIRTPDVNAFALPQGDIYLPVGLLAQLDNEAQLAQVLAHEQTHVLERHGIEALRSRRRKAIAAQVAGMATLGIGSAFASVPYQASVTSYQREHEEEADTVAFAAVQRAGYDPVAAASLYDALAAVLPPAAVGGESIYSTHPSLTARAAYTRALIATTPSSPGRIDTEAYHAAIDPLAPEFVRLLLKAKRPAQAREYADRVLAREPDAAWAHCAKAAAHQSIADDPETAALERAIREGRQQLDDAQIAAVASTSADERDQAAASFRRCRDLDPQAPAAYRGLALIAHAKGDGIETRRAVAQYLSLAPDAPDRRFVQSLLVETPPP